MNVAELFAGPLRGWVQPGVGVIAVGPYDACALLRERVGRVRLGGESSRLLTLRVAERMAGTIGVLGVYGDGWYETARTAQRRRAELRKVGIEFVSDLAPVSAWTSGECCAPRATPDSSPPPTSRGRPCGR